MATFLALQQELAAQAGLDQTVSSQATLLKRWINNAQSVVMRSYDWPFLRCQTPMIVQTVTDYTTGTVATVAGSSTVTFSATITPSKANQYLQTVSSNDWYQITTHTSGTATATLNVPAIYTNSAATFIIRKVWYSTDATVDRIIQIYQDIFPLQLGETSPEYFQSYDAGFLSSGTPILYLPSGVDSSGYPQFRLWPNASAVINLQVSYIKKPVDMTADADICVVPDKWATTVLLEFAKLQAFSFDDDTRYKDSYVMAYKMLDDMKNEYEIGLNRLRVMTPSDAQPTGGTFGYLPLPYNYPRGTRYGS